MEQSTDHRVEFIGGYPAPDDNFCDVWVWVDGKRFTAVFFTPEGIQRVMQRHRQSGESAGGTYFWTVDLVVVRELDKEVILETIADLVATGDAFRGAFGGPYAESEGETDPHDRP